MPKDFLDLYVMFLSIVIVGCLYLLKHIKLIGIRTKGKKEKEEKEIRERYKNDIYFKISL